MREANLVEIWIRKDPIRWLAGALGGIFAIAVMIGFAMIANKLLVGGHDMLAPLKIPVTVIMGGDAMNYESTPLVLLAGVFLYSLLGAFLGVAFAHLTGTNNKAALFGMGITWGIFGWIFLENLFSKSWQPIKILEIPATWGFLGWVLFGVSLMSVGFFDQMLRSKKN